MDVLEIINIVMISLTAIFAIAIAISALVGFFAGWKRSLVVLCRVCVSGILAFATIKLFTSIIPANTLIGDIAIPILDDMGMGEFLEIIESSEGIQTITGSVIYTVVLPFVFVVLFTIWDLLMRIPAYFIGKLLGCNDPKIKKKKLEAPQTDETPVSDGESTPDSAQPQVEFVEVKLNIWEKLGGAAIRAVTAFAIIMITLMPTTGLMYTFTEGILGVAKTADEVELNIEMEDSIEILDHKLVKDGMLDTGEIYDLLNDTVSPVTDNVFLKMSFSAPMRAIYSEIGGSSDSSGSFRNEIAQLFDLASDTLYLLVDFEEYGDDQKRAVSDIIGYISHSKLHSEVAADIISGISKDVLNGDEVFGNDLSVVTDGDTGIISRPALEILSETTAQSISSDLDTISNVLCAAIDHNLPQYIAEALAEDTTENLMNKLSDEEFIYIIISEIYENEDFHEILPHAIDFTFTVIIRQFDADAEPAKVSGNFENLSDDDLRHESELFAEIITDAVSVINGLGDINADSDAMDAIEQTNMRAMGRMLDSSFESKFIGDGMHDLFIVMLQSESFNSMREVANILESHIYDEGLIMENLLVAVQEFTGILSKYEKSGSHDMTELANRMRTLSSSFDPTTTVIIKEIINDSNVLGSNMISGGGSSSVSQNSQKVLNVFVDKLASGEIDEEDYEKEAKAVDYAMQMLNTSSSGESSGGIKDLYNNDPEGMGEMIDTLSDSKIAADSLNAIAYDEEGNLTPDALELKENTDQEDIDTLLSECEKHYKEEITKEDCDVETLETNLKAIASIFGEDITDDIELWKNQPSA